MDFTAFDTSRIEEYSRRAKEQWGSTPEYKEYEEKSKNRTKTDEKEIMKGLMKVFEEFGTMKEMDPASKEVQEQVKKLQDFITDHFYKCTDETLLGLGRMYAGGGEFTENIDRMGGAGTAAFTYQAIKSYCKRFPVE